MIFWDVLRTRSTAPFYLLLRFHNLRSPEIYGDTIHKMIEKVRSQLSQPTPVRQSWLQLIKDLASFVQCTAGLEKTEWSGFTGKAPVRFHWFRKPGLTSVQHDLQNGSTRDVLMRLLWLAEWVVAGSTSTLMANHVKRKTNISIPIHVYTCLFIF